MDTIQFFGQKLAIITEKPPLACSAFIRLAIRDAGRDLALAPMTREELEKIVEGPLRERLAALKLGNVDEITERLLLEVKRNH